MPLLCKYQPLLCLLACWLEATVCLFAQNPALNCNDPNSSLGGFDIDATKGCVPHTIKLTDKSGASNVQYSYDFNPFNPSVYTLSTQNTHTFAQDGTFSVVQTGTKNGKNFAYCRSLSVRVFSASFKPTIVVQAASESRVSLLITNGGYDDYVVDWGDGTVEPVIQNSQSSICHEYSDKNRISATVTVKGIFKDVNCGNSSSQTVNVTASKIAGPTITRLSLENDTEALIQFKSATAFLYEIWQKAENEATYTRNFQIETTPTDKLLKVPFLDNKQQTCFKVLEKDACGLKLESAPVCSIPMTATTESKEVQLTWKAAPNFTDYTLNKANQAIPKNTQTEHLDKAVECNKSYCYRVTSKQGSTENLSQVRCVTIGVGDSLKNISGLFSTFVNNKVLLSWDNFQKQDLVGKWNVYRATNQQNAPFSIISSNPDNLTATAALPFGVGKTVFFQDANNQVTDIPFCYKLTYADLCGRESKPTTPTCPVLLSPKGSKLTWTDYKQADNPNPIYWLDKMNTQGQLIESKPMGSLLNVYADLNDATQQIFQYKIRAIGSPAESHSNVITFVYDIGLHIPNIFTPNNDGINDIFEIKGLFIKQLRLQIFNRWGEIVFLSTGLTNGWDGTYHNQPAPTDLYTYILETEDLLGRIFQKQGVVQLMR